MPFSIAERDRRWDLVRSLMESAGITILVLTDPPSSRYLTQVDDPAGAAIFLQDADPTVFLSPRGQVGLDNGWLRDVRPLGERWAPPIIDRLRELGGDRAIVGVTGLDPQLRAPEGSINYHSFVMMREWLNHARWVGARALLREAADVKSGEEIDALRRSAAAAEAGLSGALKRSANQLTDTEFWASAEAAMTLAGAPPPHGIALTVVSPSLSPGSGDRGRGASSSSLRPSTKPQGRAFIPGEIALAELAASHGGYTAPLVQPIAVRWVSGAWKDAWQVHQEAWTTLWKKLRIGCPLEDLHNLPGSDPYRTEINVEGAGLGDDFPWVEAGVIRAAALAGPTLREGQTFLLRPVVKWTEVGAERQLIWADSVVITADGPERLGERPAILRVLE